MSEEPAQRRPIVWRIALTLWNVALPGIGLVRVSGVRRATPWLIAPYAAIIVILLICAVTRTPDFAVFALGAFLVFAICLATVLTPAVLTWRASRFRSRSSSPWQRWYGLIAIWAIATLAWQPLAPLLHRTYKPYYIPSLSMIPTLAPNDRIFADMRDRHPPRRGEIVIYECNDSARVSRVVAIAGDRVAVQNDRPIVNGVAAAQQPDGVIKIDVFGRSQTAQLRREQFPGEPRSHEVAVLGNGAFADMTETPVPTGYLFLLGDDRDLAADSRVPMTEEGCGMVAQSAILGRPLYVTWSREHRRIGTDLRRG